MKLFNVFKKEQISHLKQQVDERVDELNTIKSDLRKNEQLVNEQAETIKNILNERDSLNEIIKRLTQEKVMIDLF
jgi:predicted nuclease with TOPRIM domain